MKGSLPSFFARFAELGAAVREAVRTYADGRSGRPRIPGRSTASNEGAGRPRLAHGGARHRTRHPGLGARPVGAKGIASRWCPRWDTCTKATSPWWTRRAAGPMSWSMSIFVNPLQFGPTEDLARYPRDLPRDRRLAEERGVDALFVPSEAVMYPTVPRDPHRARADGGTVGRGGPARPFRRCADRRGQALPPHRAGRRRASDRRTCSRSVLIRQMVRDLDWPTRAGGGAHGPGGRRARAQQSQRVPETPSSDGKPPR